MKRLHASSYHFFADTFTPVELYLSLRHRYRKSCLLESNDYHSNRDSHSFIGFDPLVEIKIEKNELLIIENEEKRVRKMDKDSDISALLQKVVSSYPCIGEGSEYAQFFGRFGFEYAHQQKNIKVNEKSLDLPEVHLFLYRYLLVIDHFQNSGQLVKFSEQGSALTADEVKSILGRRKFAMFPFDIEGKEQEELDEKEFEALAEKALKHTLRGDVFQLVMSNAYKQAFFGDDFAVYRALRHTNPSPYLFYFDFEDYHLFGSSPEAQLKIEKGIAEIHPIAGTVLRTGDRETDQKAVDFLVADDKENAEHTMLVDLARNDLSRHCETVRVERYKEIQSFSHVFHMVSKVCGTLRQNESALETFQACFPAGTLSGTPKQRAQELIASYEPSKREYYGGAIGAISASGEMNTAIVIRSVLSKNGYLHYRAGAGIVHKSKTESEYQEIQNKLGAVRRAIELAEKISHPLEQFS